MAAVLQPTSIAGHARAVLADFPGIATPTELREKLVEVYPTLEAENPKVLLTACRRAFELANTEEAMSQPDVQVDAEPTQPWTVEDGNYTWRAGGGQHFSLSVELVDELFYNFSKNGLNLSQTQVLNKFNLQVWQWNSLKSKLNLYKLSDIFSPYTVSITAPEKLDEMVRRKMDARFANRGLIVEQAYSDSTNKQYLKVIREAEQNTFLNQRVVAELADRFPEAKVRYLLRGATAANAPTNLVITIADIHAGANVKGLTLSPDYNLKQLYAYADQIIAKTNSVGAAKVWITFGGDAIESFSGMNHPDSWKNIELHGADVIAAAFEFFEYLLARIQNVAGLLAVGGNHDRAASSNKDESTAEIAKTLFYFLKKSYGHAIDIEYQTEVLARHIDGIRYVMTHGGKGNTGNDSKAKDLFYNYGDPACFTVLLTAHLHSRMIKLDSHNKRHLVVPSLFTGNPYSENLGFSSTAGFLQISNDGHGLPRVVDETLYPLAKAA